MKLRFTVYLSQNFKAPMKVIIHLLLTKFSLCKAHHCSVSNNQQKDLSLRILQCNHVSIKINPKSWYLIFELSGQVKSHNLASERLS